MEKLRKGEGLQQQQRGSPAAVLQFVALANACAGAVGTTQILGPVAVAGAIRVDADLGGRCVVTRSIGGQVMSKMVNLEPVATKDLSRALAKDAVTIGCALEAVVAIDGVKPVDKSDAAAIQVEEKCATRSHDPSSPG